MNINFIVAGHHCAVITARDTIAPTLLRGDITASEFITHDVIARYLYRARHYSEFYFKLCTRIFKKLNSILILISF
jgi:hypothetical protein